MEKHGGFSMICLLEKREETKVQPKGRESELPFLQARAQWVTVKGTLRRNEEEEGSRPTLYFERRKKKRGPRCAKSKPVDLFKHGRQGTSSKPEEGGRHLGEEEKRGLRTEKDWLTSLIGRDIPCEKSENQLKGHSKES